MIFLENLSIKHLTIPPSATEAIKRCKDEICNYASTSEDIANYWKENFKSSNFSLKGLI